MKFVNDLWVLELFKSNKPKKAEKLYSDSEPLAIPTDRR